MDEGTTHGSHEGRASVRDVDPEGRKGQGDSHSQTRAKGQVRVFEETAEQGRQTTQHVAEELGEVQERANRVADAAGGEAKSLALASPDDQAMALGGAANFMLSWQQELAGFLNTRIEKNVRFGRNLFEVRDSATLLRLCGEFGRETISDYATCVTGFAERSIGGPQQRGGEVLRSAEEANNHLQVSAERIAERA